MASFARFSLWKTAYAVAIRPAQQEIRGLRPLLSKASEGNPWTHRTRHALKQDKLVQATKTSVDWFEENRSTVIRAGIAAIVCLAIAIGALVVYSKRSAAADLAFGEAMDTYNAPLAQPGQPTAPGKRPSLLPLRGPSWQTSSLSRLPADTVSFWQARPPVTSRA